MTLSERAEKMADAVGINPNWGREETVRYYTDEIRAAVNEAIQEAKAEAFEEAADLAHTYSCHSFGGTNDQRNWAHEIEERIRARAKEVAGTTVQRRF